MTSVSEVSLWEQDSANFASQEFKATNDNRQLTGNGYSNFLPTWSPDGDYIAYLTLVSDDQYQLNTILADGGDPIPYPHLPPGSLFEIAWRPTLQEVIVEIVSVDFADPANDYFIAQSRPKLKLRATIKSPVYGASFSSPAIYRRVGMAVTY
ncbi:MAG: hypothetical protein GY805_08540 [Chloroflexi bacterium]|nr:hypothetical protein [Chloroflexota bacterium]